MEPHFQSLLHDQLGQGKSMGRATHVLLHQQHPAARLDVQAAGIEADALADDCDLRVLFIAPVQFDHARRVAARGGAADPVDHRKAALQSVAAGYLELGAVGLGDQLRLVLQLGRAHVLRRGVDQIADQGNGGGFGQNGVDRLDVLRQKHARPFLAWFGEIAVKAVLAGHPAEQGRARFTPGAAVGSGGQDFGQLGHAPARQAFRIGHPGDGEPVLAVRQDRMGIAFAFELLRGHCGALHRRQALDEGFETFLVDKVDCGGLLAAVGLDQGVLVCHRDPTLAAAARQVREELLLCVQSWSWLP